MGALPCLIDFGVEKSWADVGGAEAGSVSRHPQLPSSSGHCSEAATQLPSRVGIRVGVILPGPDT